MQTQLTQEVQQHGERRIVRALIRFRFGEHPHPGLPGLTDWVLTSGHDLEAVTEAVYRADDLPQVALVMEAVRSGVHFSVAEIADFCRDDWDEALAWILTSLLVHRFGFQPGLPEVADHLAQSGAGELELIRAIHQAPSAHQALSAVRQTERL